jgi:SPOR domain
MADNSLRYRTNPLFPRSRPSTDDTFASRREPDDQLIDQASDDPLAELARLVGHADPFVDPHPAQRHDLGDPRFDELAASAGQDTWSAQARSHQEYELQAPPLADDRYDERGEAQNYATDGGEPNWDANEQAAYEEPRHDEESRYRDAPRLTDPGYDERDYRAAGDGAHADDGYADQRPADERYVDEQYADEQYADQQHTDEQYDDRAYADDGYAGYRAHPRAAPRARRGRMMIVAAVLGLAVAGTAGAYAFRNVLSGGAPAAPPVIKADTSPTKIAAGPSDGTGGKQIFDRIGERGQNERMVPREEQPLDIKPSQAQAPAVGGWPMAQAAPPSGAPPAQRSPPLVTDPRPVKTVTISGASQTPPQGAAGGAPESAPAPIARAQSPRPAPQTDTGAPLALAPAAPAPRPAASGSLAHYVVQLSASNSRQEAEAALRTAQSKYSDLIGGRETLVRERKSAEKATMYAAQVGGFASRDEAQRICQQLQSAGAHCFVP